MKKPYRHPGDDVIELLIYRVTTYTQTHIDSLKHRPTDNSVLKYAKSTMEQCLRELTVCEMLSIYEDFYGEIREYNMNIDNGSTDTFTSTKNWLDHIVELELSKQYA